MRILIASDLYWPVINGVSTFARTLAKGLADRGHEVLVIAPSQTGRKHKETDGNYTIARTATVVFPFYQNYRISLYPYSEVKKIIKDFKPDVMHTQSFLMIGQAVVKYGQKYGIPVVSTNHAMPENLMDNLKMLAPISRPIKYVLNKYIVRFNLQTDYFTMPTQSAINMFDLSHNKYNVPIEAVSNGIDLSMFTVGKADPEVLKKLNVPSDKPLITFLGRVDAEKHVSVLVRAFAKVVQKKDARLLIVGSGTDVDNLMMLSNHLGIQDKVIFTGRITDEEKVEIYKAGTVFCMPSPAELQSIVMLEAMASGQPVVAIDAGPLKELCQDGRNGFLCKPDDDAEIAEALLKIISDPTLHDKMSRESIAIAATHDLNKTLERFEQIYTSLVNVRKP